jgi:hypothetical protein
VLSSGVDSIDLNPGLVHVRMTVELENTVPKERKRV